MKQIIIPDEFNETENVKISVDNRVISLYKTKVAVPPMYIAYNQTFGYFDSTDKVKVTIEVQYKVHSAVIRPLSYGIKADIEGNKIIFEMEPGQKVSVEPNDDFNNAVLLFCNSPEEEQVSKTDENVIYFGEGVHDAGEIVLSSNQTLYIADGAFVNGKIVAENAENIKILGRGIISGKKIKDRKCEIRLNNCKNVKLEGIVILDPSNWHVFINGCENVDVDNLKLIGYRGNSDGIDICGSRNVKVNNCFVRGCDDCLTVKGFDTGNAENIEFANCVLWNDMARTIEIGYENRADIVRNIRFNNIDIIHALSGYPILGVHEGDRAVITDVLFEDIRIEHAPGAQIFDLRIKPSCWNSDTGIGRIENVKFKNISLLGNPGIDMLPAPSRIEGYSEESNITDITFENITMLGKSITNAEECNLQILDYSASVNFINTEVINKISVIKTRMEIEEISNGHRVTVHLTNTDKTTIANGRAALSVYPKVTDDIEFEFDIAPEETIKKVFEIELPVGRYYVSIRTDYVGLISDWDILDVVGDLNCKTEYDICDPVLNKLGKTEFYIENNELVISAQADNMKEFYIYTAIPTDKQEGEAVFILPQTLCGECPSVVFSKGEYKLAPELRNSLEITMVFKNQPIVTSGANLKIDIINKKVYLRKFNEKEFETVDIDGYIDENGLKIRIPLRLLDIPCGSKEMLLEITANTSDGVGNVFKSNDPQHCVCMYGKYKINY